MSESFLVDPQTPVNMKKACRHWHSRDTAVCSIRNIHKSPRQALVNAKLGMRFDKSWPFYFGYQVARSLKRFLLSSR
jgi:hypothetical protein